MDNIRVSSSITYRTTNTWRVRYSCTSLPENPIKVGVAIPSTKPTIYSLVSCPVHLPICEPILTPGNAKTTQKSSLIRIEWKYKDPGYPCHYVVSFVRKEVLMSRGCNGRRRPFWVTIKRPSASKMLWNKFEWQQRLALDTVNLATSSTRNS